MSICPCHMNPILAAGALDMYPGMSLGWKNSLRAEVSVNGNGEVGEGMTKTRRTSFREKY